MTAPREVAEALIAPIEVEEVSTARSKVQEASTAPSKVQEASTAQSKVQEASPAPAKVKIIEALAAPFEVVENLITAIVWMVEASVEVAEASTALVEVVAWENMTHDFKWLDISTFSRRKVSFLSRSSALSSRMSSLCWRGSRRIYPWKKLISSS